LAINHLPSEYGPREKGCPACGYPNAYRLGDGRLKCKYCRTKYTPSGKFGRLPSDKLRGICEHFWNMTPCDQTASALFLNRKTVQRYFSLIRERIAKAGEKELDQQMEIIDLQGFYVGKIKAKENGTASAATVPVCGLARAQAAICLVLPNGLRDWSRLDLKSVRYVAVGKEANLNNASTGSPEAMEFWEFATPRLKRYRGAYRKRPPVFLREMEFRFNHRQDPQVLDRLLNLLSVGPV